MPAFVRKLVLIVAVLGFFTAQTDAKPGQTRHVNVKRAPLLPTPSPFSKAITILTVNDTATILEEKGAYLKVKTSTGHTGWLAESNLQKKKMDLTKSVSRANGGADNPELASAVPGFNGDVEKQFQTTNPKISFKDVDRMEKWDVTPAQSLSFFKKGGLKTQSGESK